MRCIGYKQKLLTFSIHALEWNSDSKICLAKYLKFTFAERKMLALLPDCISDNTGLLIFEILIFKIIANVNNVYLLMHEFKAALRLIA